MYRGILTHVFKTDHKHTDRSLRKKMLALFFGCLLIAFGPAAMFLVLVVLHHSHLTVLSIVAAFFELIGILATSIVWFVMPGDFTGRTATALVIGVFLQELARLGFVFAYGHGEFGLARVSGVSELPFSDFPSAVSAGFGFGLMYALLVYGNILGLSAGEADLRLASCPDTSLYLVEAFSALAMEILHVALMVLAFDAMRRDSVRIRRFLRWIPVFILHLLASLATLLNSDASLGGCSLGMYLVYTVVSLSVFYTVVIVRSSSFRIKGTFPNPNANRTS